MTTIEKAKEFNGTLLRVYRNYMKDQKSEQIGNRGFSEYIRINLMADFILMPALKDGGHILVWTCSFTNKRMSMRKSLFGICKYKEMV